MMPRAWQSLSAVLLASALLAWCSEAFPEDPQQAQLAAGRRSFARARAVRQPVPWVSMHTVVPSSCTREADWEVVGLYYSFLRCARCSHSAQPFTHTQHKAPAASVRVPGCAALRCCVQTPLPADGRTGWLKD